MPQIQTYARKTEAAVGEGMVRTILHVDLNNLNASVECLYHPKLRGRPVAVSGAVRFGHMF